MERFNLNTVTREELIEIGFGASLSRSVILYRAGRRFRDVSELLNIKGIGKGTYEKVKDKLFIEGDSDSDTISKDALIKRIFPQGIPKTDDEWNHPISARAIYEAIIKG